MVAGDVGLLMKHGLPLSGRGEAFFADGLKRAVDIGLGNVGAVCFLKTIWAGGGFS